MPGINGRGIESGCGNGYCIEFVEEFRQDKIITISATLLRIWVLITFILSLLLNTILPQSFNATLFLLQN